MAKVPIFGAMNSSRRSTASARSYHYLYLKWMRVALLRDVRLFELARRCPARVVGLNLEMDAIQGLIIKENLQTIGKAMGVAYVRPGKSCR